MMKVIVLLGTAVIAFLVTFAFVTRDEIADEVRAQASDNSKQMQHCERQLARQIPNPARASDICGCMLREFENRGLDILDTFGDELHEMQQITRNCAQVYGM